MALPADFNKIYGSAATGGLTPINDVNYAKGWEFVGSNPPTKNDFTYLQNSSDLKSQWLYLNKLQRTDPFGDIKSDGSAAIATALSNLGLTAITTVSGLTDTFPYFTSGNSAKLTPLTSFARTLLSKPDDIDARNALGLGSAAQLDVGTTAGTVAAGNDSRFGKIIGVGQSWQDVTASRAAGVTYTNSTGRPIMVIVSGRNAATSKYAYVDLVTVGGFTNIDAGTVLSSISFIVPEGSSYSISSGISITGVGAGWSELR